MLKNVVMFCVLIFVVFKCLIVYLFVFCLNLWEYEILVNFDFVKINYCEEFLLLLVMSWMINDVFMYWVRVIMEW